MHTLDVAKNFIEHKIFKADERARLAEKGQAMPGGGYPIRNRSDLKNAIQAYGRAKNKAAAKAWIIKRAKALDLVDLLPEGWVSEGEASHMTIVNDVLEHYGTKGMKWGVRRAEKKWQKNIYSTRGAIAVHNAAADIFNERIGPLNARHPKADMLLRPNSPETRRYLREAEALSSAAFSSAVQSVHGTSPSGQRRARMDTSNPDQYQIVIDSVDVEHATETLPQFVFEVDMSKDGLIRNLRNIQDDESLEQSNIVGEFLEHYGVKGMQWGVRKKRSLSDDAKKVAANRGRKASELSNQQLRELNERLNLEQNYNRMNPTRIQRGQRTAAQILAVGGTVNAAIALARSPAGRALRGRIGN